MYSILIEGKWVLWRETELFLKYLVFTLKEISHAEDIFLAEQREREREREKCDRVSGVCILIWELPRKL